VNPHDLIPAGPGTGGPMGPYGRKGWVPASTPGGGSKGFGHYLRVVWRGKWVVLAALILGGVAGLAWVVARPPVYRAQAVVEIVGVNESFMGMNQLDPMAGNYSATPANIQTQVHILMSSGLLSRVAERVNLEMTPVNTASGGVFGGIRARLGVTPDGPLEVMKEGIQRAAKTTRARPIGATRLLELSCESVSPDVAATFVNSLASEYISQSAQYRSTTAQRTSQWMEGQIEETRNRLEQAEKKLQAFIQQSGNAFVLDQATLDESKLRQLQAELAASQADRITKQTRWDIARNSSLDAIPDVLDDGRLKGFRDQLVKLQSERAALTVNFTSQHPRVMQVDAQISEISQTLKREQAGLIQRIKDEYESAVRRERMLLDNYRGQSGVLSSQSGRASDYATLKREAEMTRMVYYNLLQQTNQASVVAALPTNNVRLIESASAPEIPVSPNPKRDIPAVTLLFAAAGVGVLLLVDRIKSSRLAQTFMDPGHSSAILNVPELGVIPSARVEKAPRWALPPPFKRRESLAAPMGDFFAQQDALHLVNSFRSVFASLLGPDRSVTHKVVLITSPGPGEGKTTLAGNLAVAVASTGRRVLLIDADLRRPSLNHLFRLEARSGLGELLKEQGPLKAENLREALHLAYPPNLYLLCAGHESRSDDSATLLFSPRTAEILALARQEFDFVLVDSAPTLLCPDARLLGRIADGVILVVRSGVTHQTNAVSAASHFRQDGIAVIGTILNDWDPAGGADPYRYQYGAYQKQYGNNDPTA